MSAALIIIPLTVGVFMFGAGIGARAARKDYEPLLDRAMDLIERLIEARVREGR